MPSAVSSSILPCIPTLLISIWALQKQNRRSITGADADPLNIRLVPTLDGSAKNAPYDETGMPVAERVLFENGICRSYWGSLQHAHYIGMKDTTSMNNMVVEGGSKTLDELRSMPHIEITDFSAFDMDAVSGTCGGEIRLAYESDGTTSHPTTSGSLPPVMTMC